MVKTSVPYKKFPETPGVYIMKDAAGRILYVGKAANLRRRVSSYFERPHDVRIQTLVSRIARIDIEQKDTALEALIREAELIKKITPPFNVREKDDKSFLYFEITREKFPRVLLVRGHRKGIPSLDGYDDILSPGDAAMFARDVALLRLAEQLERAKAGQVADLRCTRTAAGNLQGRTVSRGWRRVNAANWRCAVAAGALARRSEPRLRCEVSVACLRYEERAIAD